MLILSIKVKNPSAKTIAKINPDLMGRNAIESFITGCGY